MIEKIAYDYLSANLSTPVLMERPESDTPDEFVVMEKVAGSITDHIRFATIAIQSYSLSLYGAAQLNESVHEVMDIMADHVEAVSECKMTADTNFTDTSTKRYRYQCLYNIYY